MQAPKTLLAVVSKNDKSHVCLRRAVMMAQKFRMKLLIVSVIYDQSFDMTTIMSDEDRENLRTAIIEENQGKLEALVKQHVPNEVEHESHVAWGSREYEAIRDIVSEQSCDLVIKFVKHESAFSRLFFTPQDWHILREVPTNILFVKGEDWVPNGNIIASVSAEDEDTKHAILNQAIVDNSLFLGEKFAAQVHVANVFPYPLVDVPLAYSGIDYEAYCANIRKAHEASTQSVLEGTPIDDKHVHVIEGLPEEAIPELADKLNAELVVLGTVARKGVSGAVIGNTAERILDKINCDVLAVKL